MSPENIVVLAVFAVEYCAFAVGVFLARGDQKKRDWKSRTIRAIRSFFWLPEGLWRLGKYVPY